MTQNVINKKKIGFEPMSVNSQIDLQSIAITTRPFFHNNFKDLNIFFFHKS